MSISEFKLIGSAGVLVGLVSYWFWWFFASWQHKRDFDRYLREVKAGRNPTSIRLAKYRFSISFDSTGFAVTDLRSHNTDTLRMTWK